MAETPQPGEEFISIRDAAQLLGVSVMTVRRMLYAGELQAFKVRGEKTYRLRRADVEALKQPQPVEFKPKSRKKKKPR